eukprot:gene33630-41493_t
MSSEQSLFSTSKVSVKCGEELTITYNDVPYLLPCSVCKRSASEAFAAEMLAIEKRMPDISRKIKLGMNHASQLDVDDGPELHKLIGHLIPKRYPTCHRLSLTISDAICACIGDSSDKDAHLKAVDKLLLPFEGKLMDVPSMGLVNASMIVNRIIFIDIHKSKAYMQKALRMFMLIAGRDEREVQRDRAMNVILIECPTTIMTECAFCGETPDAVAITLSRCARCQKLAYCGRGCQMAHWEEHKRMCKKLAVKK